MLNLFFLARKSLSADGFKKYFVNTSWVMVDKVLKLVAGVFVTAWVARYLGPDQFGTLSYSQSFVFLFLALSSLGLDSVVIRELVKDEESRDKFLGTAFLLKLIGSFSMFPIMAVMMAIIDERSANTLIYIIAAATVLQSFNVIDFYFQAKVQSKYTAIVNLLVLLFSSTVKIYLINVEAPLLMFAWVFLIDAGLVAFGLIYFYCRNKDNGDLFGGNPNIFLWSFNWDVARKLLNDSWPLMMSTIVVSVYMRIDQVMIKYMLDLDAVGQYAAAARISEAWYFVPVGIVASVFPAILRARERSRELYLDRLQNLYTFLTWLAIIFSVLTYFLADWIILVHYGQEYLIAKAVLLVHVWSGVFVFMGVAFSSFLVAENMPKKAFIRTLIGALLNVGLNIFLIARYGVSGAAIASLASQAFANVFYDLFDKDLRTHARLKFNAFFPYYILRKN